MPLLVLLLAAAPGCGSDDEAAPEAESAEPCVPVCGPERCGEEDGCGGRCACESEASCLSCPLRLQLVGDPSPDGRVSVSLESSAVANVPLPRLADLTITADRPVRLERIAIGPALAAAAKRLHRFTDTDLPWQRRADGSYRLLVYSGRTHAPVAPGRWLTLRFAVEGDASDVRFSLVRRPDAVAPAAADQALQASRYDKPLLVPVGR